LKPAVATADAVSFHWYPRTGQVSAGVAAIAATVSSQLQATGFARIPLWISEMNVGNGSSLSARGQQQAMQSMTDSAANAGIDRSWWYAWTDLGPEDLIQIREGTPAARWLLGNGSLNE